MLIVRRTNSQTDASTEEKSHEELQPPKKLFKVENGQPISKGKEPKGMAHVLTLELEKQRKERRLL
jgi:hypothetical protein